MWVWAEDRAAARDAFPWPEPMLSCGAQQQERKEGKQEPQLRQENEARETEARSSYRRTCGCPWDAACAPGPGRRLHSPGPLKSSPSPTQLRGRRRHQAGLSVLVRMRPAKGGPRMEDSSGHRLGLLSLVAAMCPQTQVLKTKANRSELRESERGVQQR